MHIEPRDLEVIGIAEGRGQFLDEEIGQAEWGIAYAEYRQRLERLVSNGLIRSFHLTLVVPPLLGGNWVLGAVIARCAEPLTAAGNLARRLPFVTEIFVNSCLPADVGHNLGLVFYSRDFQTESRFIREEWSARDVEVLRVQDYEFPVALTLSREEWAFIRCLQQNPGLDPEGIARVFGSSPEWVRAKIARLLWSETNPSGVFRIQASIDWTRCSNFGHFHILIETGHRPEVLEKNLSGEKLRLVFRGMRLGGRYIGVEADVWGVAELLNRVEFLSRLGGVRVAGVIYNREILINDRWVKNVIPE